MYKCLFEALTKREVNSGALHLFSGFTQVCHTESVRALSAPAPVNCLGRWGQDAQTGDKGLSVVSLRGALKKKIIF